MDRWERIGVGDEIKVGRIDFLGGGGFFRSEVSSDLVWFLVVGLVRERGVFRVLKVVDLIGLVD